MNNNPYKVLGVSESASQEEIRAAYLSLVKKYHPDKYRDSDLKEIANDKLMEVNEAYETLTKKGNGKGSSASSSGSYQSYGGYSGAGSSYSGQNAAEFARARSYISLNNLTAAKQILDRIDTRNAEWYYLYGIIYLRQGWYDKANEYITNAYQQEPNNAEYSSAYHTVRNTGNPYTRGGRTYTANANDCDGCSLCSSLICADCCCECLSGGNCDIIPCC